MSPCPIALPPKTRQDCWLIDAVEKCDHHLNVWELYKAELERRGYRVCHIDLEYPYKKVWVVNDR